MTDHDGTERRVHKVYVTANTEYHVRRDLCVAVRDRRTGRWLEGHLALRKRVEGAVIYLPNGLCPRMGPPQAGDRLYFHTGERDLVTSKLESIQRPARQVVHAYPR